MLLLFSYLVLSLSRKAKAVVLPSTRASGSEEGGRRLREEVEVASAF